MMMAWIGLPFPFAVRTRTGFGAIVLGLRRMLSRIGVSGMDLLGGILYSMILIL